MIIYAWIFLALGGLGCLGMTFLFPLCGIFFYPRRPLLVTEPTSPSTLDMEIIIPARNEQDTIGATIESILHVKTLSSAAIKMKIRVGIDSCTDNTYQVAKSLAVDELTTHSFQSKWHTINQMVKDSRADWIALVDAGAIWPVSLIQKINVFFYSKDVMAISPAYCPAQENWVKKIQWRLEQALKSLEGLSGGPVSVHGATVFYRRESLQRALALLVGRAWKNDDIAIPLALFLDAKEQRIVYLNEKFLEGHVSDIGTLKKGMEFKRRRRMVFGNLEWIIYLLLPQLRHLSAPTLLISLRRVFRVFWIYWLTFLVVGANCFFYLYGFSFLAVILNICSLGVFLCLKEASFHSFLAPYYLLPLWRKAGVDWK